MSQDVFGEVVVVVVGGGGGGGQDLMSWLDSTQVKSTWLADLLVL